MKTCLMTHHDLDGAASAIFMCKVREDITVTKYCFGYDQIDRMLDEILAEGFESIIITDLAVGAEQLMKVCKQFKQALIIDHHDQSAETSILPLPKHVEYRYKHGIAATAMCFGYAIEKGYKPTEEEIDFCKAVDAYDMWRTKTKFFETGYKYNDLFWKYKFFDFVYQFSDGRKINKEEERHCEKEKAEKLKIIHIDSAMELVNENKANATAILLTDRKAINDVTLELQGELFYIITKNPVSGSINMSLRAKPEFPDVKDYDMNKGAQFVKMIHPEIVKSGGGHKYASGMSFHDGVTIGDIMTLIRDDLDPFINT